MFVLADGKDMRITFFLVASLFLLWGLCNGMIDTMDKHFQDQLHLRFHSFTETLAQRHSRMKKVRERLRQSILNLSSAVLSKSQVDLLILRR